jgi:hypothetical protein
VGKKKDKEVREDPKKDGLRRSVSNQGLTEEDIRERDR